MEEHMKIGRVNRLMLKYIEIQINKKSTPIPELILYSTRLELMKSRYPKNQKVLKALNQIYNRIK